MAKKFRKRFSWKKLLSLLLAIVSIAGAIFGVVKLSEYLKDDTKEIHPSFKVGGLATSTGSWENVKDSIATEESFSAKGLEVKLDFDSSVTYQVFFYDDMDNFLSATDVYARSMDIAVPINAYARLEVTPIWGEDAPLEKEIKWYDVNDYSSQLEIRVDKEQRLLESDFSRYAVTGNNFIKHTNYDISTGSLVADEEHDVYEFSLSGDTGYVLENDALAYFDFDNLGVTNPENDIVLYTVSADGELTRTIWTNFASGSSFENPISWQEGTHVYLRATKDFFNCYDVDMFLYFCLIN